MSSYGVMRGLHFQRPPYTQSKLVRCVKGSVLDVAVDIRKGSPTYGQHVSVELTENNHLAVFIPITCPCSFMTAIIQNLRQYCLISENRDTVSMGYSKTKGSVLKSFPVCIKIMPKILKT